ncbi:MAG TPA: hypothetical protein VH475_18735 [Tepidisphaeraceae bacterium]
MNRGEPSRRRAPVDYAGTFVILNLTLWAQLLVGTSGGMALTFSIWGGGVVAVFAWECWAARRRERKARPVNGLCASCAYDLRESPLRCPECGASVPAGHRTRSGIASNLERVE